MNEVGIIYVLTNQSMPGLVKIGRTKNIKRRLQELDTTGVPTPFELHYAIEIDNYKERESLIHQGLSVHRVRKNREFFKYQPEDARAILKAIGGKEVNLEYIGVAIDEDGNETSIEEYATKLPPAPVTTFDMLKIEKGEIIAFTRNEDITCKVLSSRKVEYNNKEYSLSALTREILQTKYNWKSSFINGFQFWKYDGEILTDRRERIEEENEQKEDI